MIHLSIIYTSPSCLENGEDVIIFFLVHHQISSWFEMLIDDFVENLLLRFDSIGSEDMGINFVVTDIIEYGSARPHFQWSL
jgi:hypothetical protein